MLSEKDKKILVEKTKIILEIHNITLDVNDINPNVILSLIEEISEAIKSSINITTYIRNTEINERPLVVIQIIIEVISDPELDSILSEDIKIKINDFVNNTETVNTLISAFSWANTELLELLDTNNDGKVSALEVEVACYNCLTCTRGEKTCACYESDGCCACCGSFSNKLSKIFSEIFMRVICCGCSENQISYNSNDTEKNQV